MAGIRDDSAGDYGQWINPQDQSWLDYLGMKAADVGGGAYNALANITGSLSPIGTSEQGNMAFQVPPMVTGLYDSAKRIGQRGGFTRVPELDEQLKQDLANGLLSIYGGNAMSGLTKPRGALGAGAMREAGGLPMDHASKMARAKEMGFDTDRILNHTTTAAPFDAFKLPDYADGRVHAVYTSPNQSWEKFIDPGNGKAHTRKLLARTDKPFLWDGNNMEDTARRIREIYPEWEGGFYGGVNAEGKDAGHTMRMSYGMSNALKANGYDSLHAFRNGNALDDEWAILYPENLRDLNAAFDPAKADSANLLYSDTGKPSIFGSALATAGEQPKGIVAYHGSPHDFDKFSLDAIGTGEGAQAYGHGLYFADSEGVARSYRDALSGLNVDGQQLTTPMADDAFARSALAAAPIDQRAADLISTNVVEGIKGGFDLDQIAADLIAQRGGDETFAAAARAAVEDAKKAARVPGRMYQVRINADPESFLDWDKPLSQQSEKVRAAFANLTGKTVDKEAAKKFNDDLYSALFEDADPNIGAQPFDPTGESAYKIYGLGKENTSQKLREAGIPGIRYLDGQSRDVGAGSSNYVVFDDSLIEILKKYGIAAGAVGAGALAQPDQASAQDMPDWLKF